MKRARFYKNNRSGDLFHIETEAALINLRINLINIHGQEVTHIQIHADVEDGWKVGEATVWNNNDGVGIRLVKNKEAT